MQRGVKAGFVSGRLRPSQGHRRSLRRGRLAPPGFDLPAVGSDGAVPEQLEDPLRHPPHGPLVAGGLVQRADLLTEPPLKVPILALRTSVVPELSPPPLSHRGPP